MANIAEIDPCYYTAFQDGHLMDLTSDRQPSHLVRFIHSQLRGFVLSPEYSCVGAKSAFLKNSYRFGVFDQLASDESTQQLSEALKRFIVEQPSLAKFSTFVAVFVNPVIISERDYEKRLWDQLQKLHDIDAEPWDPEVSSDPEDPEFSFSFAGRSFFIIGLHPAASRITRRFAYAAMIFNAHHLFEQLRAEGKFRKIRDTIRDNEVKIQHSLNPAVADFGEKSEAIQYSGRKPDEDEDWECPLKI